MFSQPVSLPAYGAASVHAIWAVLSILNILSQCLIQSWYNAPFSANNVITQHIAGTVTQHHCNSLPLANSACANLDQPSFQCSQQLLHLVLLTEKPLPLPFGLCQAKACITQLPLVSATAWWVMSSLISFLLCKRLSKALFLWLLAGYNPCGQYISQYIRIDLQRWQTNLPLTCFSLFRLCQCDQVRPFAAICWSRQVSCFFNLLACQT